MAAIPRCRRVHTAVAVCAVAALLSPASLTGLSRFTVQVGQMGLGNTGNGAVLSPVLVNVAGVSLPLAESRICGLELAALVWGTSYEYAAAVARAIPTPMETADQFAVLGVWVAPLVGLHVPVANGRLELGAAATVALNFRIPMFPRDNGAFYLADAGAYLSGSGRFVFPETDLWIRWRVSQSFALSLTFKALFPLFHLWDGEGARWDDQLFLGGFLGFSVMGHEA